MSTPTRERAEQLANLAEKRRQQCESFLYEIRSQRGDAAELTIGEQEKYRAMAADYESTKRTRPSMRARLPDVATCPRPCSAPRCATVR